MAQLIVWDAAASRHYETGIDHCVLYPRASNGTYPIGYAWNGIVSFTEKPAGADISDLWADNIKYLSLVAAETFEATIEAYTYPDEFAECDGSKEDANALGVVLGQQARKSFGLSFRTTLGNDVDGNEHGYKLHLVYGCLASPSERGYQTINDSPEAITFSWDLKTTPEVATGYKPVSLITIDSTAAGATELAALETILYGETVGPTDAELPLPDEVITTMTPP